MNPITDSTQSDRPENGLRTRLPLFMFWFTLLCALTLSTALLNGCKRRPSSISTTEKTGPKENPWELVGKKLKKETDLVACQNALRVLVENLRNDESLPKPASLGPDEERALSAIVPLGPSDLAEIHNWNYSALDAVYLAECLYLRDVVQSLKLPNLTPEQFADTGFAWVCRSIALQTWLVPWSVGEQRGFFAAALPPSYVLRRGCGSALERMYVFLALLQQMDLEGCLIGPPGAKDVGEWDIFRPDRTPYPGGPPRPFWAVGVRIGSIIKLYDPWRGEAFPASLNSLKSSPETYKSWFEDTANISGLKVEDAKAATVYLAVPVNALSPRMQMLNEKLLKDGVGVRLAINPGTLRAAFPDPKPIFWNPPDDRFAYGRVARWFLPRDQGGNDESQTPYRWIDKYYLNQLPTVFRTNLPELQSVDPQIAQDVSERMFGYTRSIYADAFLTAPNPRERIQRGDYQTAMRDLVEKQDKFSKGLELLRNTSAVDTQIQGWCASARALYEELGRTVLIADKAEQASVKATIQSNIENHWREPTVMLMVSRSSAPVCKLETSFLLALCKHEEAERTQTQADYATGEDLAGIKQKAKDAWINARAAWRTYFEGYNTSQDTIPARGIQAKTLSARSEKMAGAAK